jgi:RNA polymerase sigma factor (sigma-70 family)
MAAIFERHHQSLHRYCHSILGNSHDAADALQNTMVKALRALQGETRTIELRPWLYRIAHNESISLLRARRTDSDLDAAAHVSDTAAANVVQSRERLRSLTEDLEELTERQRGALLMRELGGLPFTEIATALQTSASAVKQSVYEARCALEAIEEGRAMSCETIRRTLSDGDRRMLRGMRMRGHLRACASCHDFEIALRQRPAQLAAMTAPLPLGAAAAMLHGLLGGSSSGGGGGGLAAGLAGTAKTTTGISLAAKGAAAMAISATLAGGAVYAAPKLHTSHHQRSTPHTAKTTGAGTSHSTPASASAAVARRSRESAAARSDRDRARVRTASAADGPPDTDKVAELPGTPATRAARTPGGKPAATPSGKPAATRRGKPTGEPAGTRGAKPAATSSGKPTGTLGRTPTTTPATPVKQPTGTSAATPTQTPAAIPAGKSTDTPAASTTGPPTSTPAVSTTGPPTSTIGAGAAHGHP